MLLSITLPFHDPLSQQKRRPALPRLWFLTDTRLQGQEEDIIKALPRGTGVVLRNYEQPNRHIWAKRLVQLCRKRHLTVLIAGDEKLASQCRADGVHWPEGLIRRPRRRHAKNCLITATAHHARGIQAARRNRADAVFVSPVFATRSHPGAAALSVIRLAILTRGSGGQPVIALGGITAATVRQLRPARIYGIAAIDGWREGQSGRSEKASRN
jgi:thiamine-phosphate pyrophosphorylase